MTNTNKRTRTSLTEEEIRTMTWTDLVAFFGRKTTSRATKRAIEREAKRCGYEFETLIAIYR